MARVREGSNLQCVFAGTGYLSPLGLWQLHTRKTPICSSTLMIESLPSMVSQVRICLDYSGFFLKIRQSGVGSRGISLGLGLGYLYNI